MKVSELNRDASNRCERGRSDRSSREISVSPLDNVLEVNLEDLSSFSKWKMGCRYFPDLMALELVANL
ncbi:hypothetical protein Csa_017536 [Cucumis sativus]|nr:hypothetical protein Csa_017536 [Cucumis sativus]